MEFFDNLKKGAQKIILLDVMIKEFNLNQSLVIVYGEWAKATLAISIQGSALIEL
ncbi:hypothetical protein MNB_SV-15-1549 [hydrothermal vent metagenome]|uniref:Uncharacterized protein n=1 Tax=hydrothermal vent metagenome TaxID=652676 RepID=A0A1W1EJX3_9ZZZZ